MSGSCGHWLGSMHISLKSWCEQIQGWRALLISVFTFATQSLLMFGIFCISIFAKPSLRVWRPGRYPGYEKCGCKRRISRQLLKAIPTGALRAPTPKVAYVNWIRNYRVAISTWDGWLVCYFSFGAIKGTRDLFICDCVFVSWFSQSQYPIPRDLGDSGAQGTMCIPKHLLRIVASR